MKTCHSHCHSSAVGYPAERTIFGYFIQVYGKTNLMKNLPETGKTTAETFLPNKLKSE
jgi:hypothetical protein